MEPMRPEDRAKAKEEIYRSLSLVNFCTRKIGLSFTDEPIDSFVKRLSFLLRLILAIIWLGLLVVGQMCEVISKLVLSSSVEAFVSKLHIMGYGIISFGKLLTLWYKKHTFRNLLSDLANLWPVATDDEDAVKIKRQKLSRLRVVQFCYGVFNIVGVLHYNLGPIFIFLYYKIRHEPATLGYVWEVWYPFDKTKPILHQIAYVFEAYGGVISVWSMLGSDIIFMTMSSHISMLLELLQLKIRRLGMYTTDEAHHREQMDCYEDIKNIVKIHKRLISYGDDLNNAFSVVNLINVMISSINICCVVFNVLIDPVLEMSNKLYVGAALTQVGILCWYADEIATASIGIGAAVYESGWYNTNIKCRRTLLFILHRAQKPLHFTAYKFSPITMSTYSSILSTSYSYFTLLYTMYRSD